MKHTRKIVWTLSLMLVLLQCSPTMQKTVLTIENTVEKFTLDSEFIFSGTIILKRTSTIDAEDVSELAIVKVDEIIKGPDTFMTLKGQSITIKLKEPDKVIENTKHIFFTRSWLFGESIGVIEMGSMEIKPSTNIKEIMNKVNRIEQEQQDKEFMKRLSLAELIVSGKAVNVTRSKGQVMATEHFPDWHEAEIEIEKVFKGTYPDEKIVILFPMSDDVMWYNSPKFKENTEGIWLLKSYEFAGQKLEHLAVVDKKDFYPKSEETKITRMLGK